MKECELLLILSTVLLSVSCTGSFFDLEPSSSMSTDKVYKTAEDFNVAVIECYSKLQTQVNFFTECYEYRSDNLYLNTPTTGTQDRYDIDQFSDKPSSGILQNAWASFNDDVYRYNLMLDKINGADFNETLKEQCKAGTLFIRALMYPNMYCLWGGIPVTDKVVAVSKALAIGRNSEQQVYDFLTGDLKQIIDDNMLPQSYTGNEVGRVTLEATRALSGRVCLTFHKREEVRDILPQVIGKYSLMISPDRIFDVDNKINSEIIFAVRLNKELESEGHGYWFSITSLGSDTNQTEALKKCYSDADNKRKELMEHTQVENKVFVLRRSKDTKSAIYNTMGNDQTVLRYAGVLLIYAETLNEIEYSNLQTSDAVNALNSVHMHSYNSSIRIVDLPDKDSFRRAITLRRQREFPYEGHRQFDLVRMGGAEDAMKAKGHEIQGYQSLYPIPKTELERINNEKLLWQNPGY